MAWYAVVWLFRVIAVIALILVLLAGCGWHGTGTVVQKDYHSAWVQTTVVCHPIGSKGQTMCVPETHYWPEKFRLKIRSDDKKTHWVSVSDSEYSSASIGGAFSNGETK